MRAVLVLILTVSSFLAVWRTGQALRQGDWLGLVCYGFVSGWLIALWWKVEARK